MIQAKKLKMIAVCMAAGLVLTACYSKYEPIEIDTSRQVESKESPEAVNVLPEQLQQNQETSTENIENKEESDHNQVSSETVNVLTEQPQQSQETSKKAVENKAEGNNKNVGERRIEDQSFDVTLCPLGQVTFSSYEPDTSQNPLADVVFRIEKGGQVLSQLPGTSEDNIGYEMFNHVEAVSFTDYNNDGYDDIILIVSYYFGAGPQAATPHSLIRYYKGTAGGNFVYEQQMSDSASSALSEITIQTAKDFIGPKRVGIGDGVGDNGQEARESLEPWQQAFLEYLNKDSKAEEQQGYTLITMSNDKIPQLVEVGRSEAAGCRIIHYGKGKAQVTQLGRLNFDYISGENLLRNADGLMGYYYNLIYSIVDGEMKLIAEGYYGYHGKDGNDAVQFDEEENPIYQYEWNGAEMGKEDYEKELAKIYDTTKAVSYGNLYSVDEVKKVIEEYHR